MTPQEKAIELVDEFMPYADGVDRQEDHDQIEEHLENAKQCALIAVVEIINVLAKDINPLINYWFEVKKEIELL